MSQRRAPLSPNHKDARLDDSRRVYAFLPLVVAASAPSDGRRVVFAAGRPADLGSGVARAENPELTVYNQNFALVKDYRPIALKAGLNDVTMDNVAALMDATSVHFKSLTAPQAVRVREQNFRYDLISRQNILDRMVGHKIRFTKEGKVREGILLNPATTVFRNGGYNGGSVGTGSSDAFAIQTPEGVLLTDLNEILIDTLPEGLYARPTLLWSLDSDKGARISPKSPISPMALTGCAITSPSSATTITIWISRAG